MAGSPGRRADGRHGGLTLAPLHAKVKSVAPSAARRPAGGRGAIGPGKGHQRVLLSAALTGGHLEESGPDALLSRGVDSVLDPVG